MNGVNPCLKDPLLPRRVQSTPLKVAGGGGRGFTVMRMRAVTASIRIIRANTKFEESKEIIRRST